jgi:hypothetical protein
MQRPRRVALYLNKWRGHGPRFEFFFPPSRGKKIRVRALSHDAVTAAALERTRAWGGRMDKVLALLGKETKGAALAAIKKALDG